MFDKLRSALNSFPNQIINKNNDKNTIDDILWNLEVSLLESDVSHEVVEELIKNLKNRISELNFNDSNDKFNLIKDELILIISSLLSNSSNFNLIEEIHKKKSSNEPYLIVFVGINGTGKTTTLAKLAQLLKNNELTCVLACADTYRAGAIEQLIEHSNRLSLKTISQSYGSDPAAVARDAIIYSKSNNIDVVLIDTAGRLQNNDDLMAELSKIIRVLKKKDSSAPHGVLLVLDATTGQNATSQVVSFSRACGITGIAMTKLDGTARGGMLVSIAAEQKTPIIYVGVGEGINDLQAFNAKAFSRALLGIEM